MLDTVLALSHKWSQCWKYWLFKGTCGVGAIFAKSLELSIYVVLYSFETNSYCPVLHHDSVDMILM